MTWLSPAASLSILRTGRVIIRLRASRLGQTTPWCLSHRSNYSTSPVTHPHPLRILFCGSDAFSETSLNALNKEHKRNPDLIRSIDVAVRPPKPVGRGLKELAPKGPIHTLAAQYKLPIHEIDTFTGWNLPQYHDLPINLIIAVSFGLFVPPRLLRACEYGGLNVHPSLLPDLRGPAPLHHAILFRDTYTGVSLQTLSDKTFDAGAVLAQTPLPGIPIDPSCDVTELSDRLARIGSEMLVQGLRDGLYLPPHVDVGWAASSPVDRPLRHAPKLVKSDYQIQWDSWAASDVVLRSTRLHEKLWTSARHRKGHGLRWSLDGVEEVEPSSWTSEMKAFAHHSLTNNIPIENLHTITLRQIPQLPLRGNSQARSRSIFGGPDVTSPSNKASLPPTYHDTILPYFIDTDDESIKIPMPLGGFIRICRITVEGKKEMPAAAVAEQFRNAKPTSP